MYVSHKSPSLLNLTVNWVRYWLRAYLRTPCVIIAVIAFASPRSTCKLKFKMRLSVVTIPAKKLALDEKMA